MATLSFGAIVQLWFMSTVLVSASKDAAVLPSGGVCEDFVAGDSDELRCVRRFRSWR